jgi:hypothetical protein
MRTRTMWAMVAAAAVLLLVSGSAGAISARLAPDAPVAGQINYQGKLTNPAGAALDGTFPMRFQLYNDPAGGTLLWDSGVISVAVDHGLFNVVLNVNPANFNGQGLWLRLYVDGEWLTPRQALLAVPYALSLRPGAEITGSSATNWLLKVQNTASPATGSAVWGEAATGMAVYGKSAAGNGLVGYSEDGYAVSGSDAGASQARGYGGYFTSQNGVGVYGYTQANSFWTNMYAPGVYGRSANGAGVYGKGDGASWPASGGVFEGRVGLSARGTGSSSVDGYAGTFVSEAYRGIYAISQGGWYDAYFPGVGGIYVAGGVYSAAASRTLVVNTGEEALQPGDVVAMAGIVESPQGGEPLLAVRRADAAHGEAVIGVAVQAVQAEMKKPEGMADREFLDIQPVEGEVPPGGYLAIVTHGLAPAVKVAGDGLRIGDMLTVSATPGAAGKAAAALEGGGTIIGKVAGPVDAGSGTVPVFVTLR